jgi:hypothetical protein
VGFFRLDLWQDDANPINARKSHAMIAIRADLTGRQGGRSPPSREHPWPRWSPPDWRYSNTFLTALTPHEPSEPTQWCVAAHHHRSREQHPRPCLRLSRPEQWSPHSLDDDVRIELDKVNTWLSVATLRCHQGQGSTIKVRTGRVSLFMYL